MRSLLTSLSLTVLLLALAVPEAADAARRRPPNLRPAVGSQLFTSPQTNPVALSCDGSLVYVANTTSGTLSLVNANAPYVTLAEIDVGMEPVGVAVRPKADCSDPGEDEQVFVTNHLSDSISVVSANAARVVQTLQELDGDGVTTTDEPVGIAFHGSSQAFVSLDRPNQIVKLTEAGGVWSIAARTPTITVGAAPPAGAFTAQAPRAIAAAGGRVFVASFESGNQSEFPSCGPGGGPAYDPTFDADGDGDPDGTGCLFPLNFANLISFATNPNIGGEVVHNALLPDRDVFVYDTNLNLLETVDGVGTLLYGIATSGDTVYVTNTDARNKHDGLNALGARMFDNRLAILDCSGASCSVSNVDLENNGFGVPVPTPYGVAVSGDGATLVASVAGSDGVPADPGDPSTVNVDIPGIVTLDASGNVLGHVQTGAIPQGLALRSDGSGAAQTAFVMNTVDSTLSVVDVSTPASPSVVATIQVGSDPTPAVVRSGRIQFSSARASTTGTFSCESCHPNGNIDQILWTINSPLGPGENCDPGSESCPEPRSTMPIRGLRDTLPLHWVGNLADPFPGVGVGGGEDPVAPDCDLAVDGEVGCIRHLVDASLSGVMCDQAGGCAVGPSGLAGALTEPERDDMAAFLAAVSFPPSPERRPDDVLTAAALQGVEDFYTDQGGLGGQIATCASVAGGCHALPLTVSSNSPTVGGFDAPSIRGLWDRHITFSNGITSTQDNLLEAGTDPAQNGMSEFGSLAATFPNLFTPVYNVPVDEIWAFINQMGVGLPGLTGRQVSLDASNEFDAGVGAQLAQIEAAADAGKIAAVATRGTQDWVYDPATGRWLPFRGSGRTIEMLRASATARGAITVTALLPGSMEAGGVARQPLLAIPGAPPTVGGGAPQTLSNIDEAYVESDATVYVDGVLCASCSISLGGGQVDVTLTTVPGDGVHLLQLQNPEGFSSNEFPFCVNSGC